MDSDTYKRCLEMVLFAAVLGSVIVGVQIYNMSAIAARSDKAAVARLHLEGKIDALASTCHLK